MKVDKIQIHYTREVQLCYELQKN